MALLLHASHADAKRMEWVVFEDNGWGGIMNERRLSLPAVVTVTRRIGLQLQTFMRRSLAVATNFFVV